MAYLTQISTSTLANQNINTALLIHTFTNTVRLRKVWIDIFLTDIVGGGDYIAHITRQRAGAGVEYESIKTTKAAGAGIISITFGSIPLTINATDVVKVYVIGLAGDNVNAVDVITEVNEEWISVDANGYAAVDVKLWLTAAPAALSTNGYLQAMVMRWLTDNPAGTPDALSTNKLPADVKLWLAGAPAALTTNGYVQAALLRWLTDNAAGTPLALVANLVQASPTAAGIADAVWDEVITIALHNIVNSAGRRLRLAGSVSIVDGQAQGGTANSIQLEVGSSAIDHTYEQSIVVITSGPGAGQARLIAEYTGLTTTAIVDRDWVTQPTVLSFYQIFAFDGILLTQHGVALGAGVGNNHIQLSATALATDDIYNGSMIVLRTGMGVGQARIITDYVGLTKVAEVMPDWVVNPDATTVYEIIPVGLVNYGAISDAVWDEAIAGHLGAGSTGARLNAAAPGAPVNLNVEETDIVVNP